MASMRWFGLTTLDAAALVVVRPDFSGLAATLHHPRTALAAQGTDAALATLVGAAVWAIAVWLGVGLLAAAAATVPGAVGRIATGASRVLLPRFLRAALAGSAGLGVLLAPGAALASPPHGVGPTPTSAAPSWPVEPTGPSPGWPTDPATAQRSHHRVPAPVAVRPGDSLWSIAADRLGTDPSPARVAAEWPRWFAANRGVIGADPGLIHPGQLLHAPADPQREHPQNVDPHDTHPQNPESRS